MATATEFTPDTAELASGNTGACATIYTMGPLYEQLAPGSEWIAVPAPVKNEGDVAPLRNGSLSAVGSRMYISGTCENPEIILQMLDYLYTDEGKMLQLYGIEGDTYTIDDEGKPEFTDKILNNEDLSFAEALEKYTMPSAILRINDWRRDLMGTPEAEEWTAQWENATTDAMLPTFTIPAEDQSEYTSLMTDIESYRDEMIVKFITGQVDLEQGWDDYIAQMKALNIDRAIEIYQNAYDSYMAKGTLNTEN